MPSRSALSASAIAAALLLLATAAATRSQHANHVFPGVPLDPGYKDEQAALVTEGTIRLGLTINGKVETNPQPNVKLVHTLELNADETITLAGAGGTRSYSCNFTDTRIEIRDGKPGPPVVTKGHSGGSRPLHAWGRGGTSAMAPMPMSAEQGAAVAFLLSPIGGTASWEIPDIQGEMTVGPVTVPTDGLVTVRVPCYGGAGGTFSKAVNQWEANGLDADGLPCPDGGFVETTYRNGKGSGHFTAAMMAYSLGAGIGVNSTVVTKHLYPPEVAQHTDFFPGSLNVSWQFGAAPPEDKLVLKPMEPKAYEHWLPIPKFEQNATTTPLMIEAEFQSKTPGAPAPRGRIDFYLTDVSRHRGECCNWPRDRAEKDDLRFADTQPKGITVDSGDPKHAWSEDQRERAIVAVVSEDGGAYGRVVAKCTAKNLTAEYEATGTKFIRVPKDDDENKIADAWEDERDAKGLSTEWDEEDAPGQRAKGDGLSVYREYRGFRVLVDGAPAYKRLSPRQKDLFVLDASNVFRESFWRDATDIRAWRVDESQVYGGGDATNSRVVDHTMGDLSGQHAYAVRIDVLTGMAEPDPMPAEPGTPPGSGDTDRQYAYTVQYGDGPKTAVRVRLFPTRMGAMLDRMITSLQKALADPNGDDARLMNGAGVSAADARTAIANWSPAARTAMVLQLEHLCAIHETGHACGTPGHLNGAGDESEDVHGDDLCPMQYFNTKTRRQWIVHTLVTGDLARDLPPPYGRFCSSPPGECLPKLNTKD